ncbi:MAG: hypothetical protein PQJ50_00710 [Spirochaetales bacterium]|nr:hypothetical protein [Spirochaetales bacterium]
MNKKILPFIKSHANTILIFFTILFIGLSVIPMFAQSLKIMNQLEQLNNLSSTSYEIGRDRIFTEAEKSYFKGLLEELRFENSGRNSLKINSKIDMVLFSLETGDNDNLYRSLLDLEADFITLNHERSQVFRIFAILMIIAVFLQMTVTTISLLRNQKIKIKHQYEEQKRTALQAIRDKERKKMAALLHDNILQDLAALSMQRDIKDSPEVLNYLKSTMDRLQNAIQSLNPIHLKSHGLIRSIEDYISSYTHSGIRFDIQTNCSCQDLPDEILEVLFTSALELITNAIVYSQAENVNIILKNEGDHFLMRIKDDGKGFQMPKTDRELAAFSTSYDYLNHRIRYERGKLALFSRPGEGVTAEITFLIQ